MPTIAEVVMRVRLDQTQIKGDAENALKQVNTKQAGTTAGQQYGTAFGSSAGSGARSGTQDGLKKIDSSGSGTDHGGKFGEGFAKGINFKSAAIGLAITGALAVGPAAIAAAGAALGIGFAAAAGTAIYKSLTTQLKAATTELAAATKAKDAAGVAGAKEQIAALQQQLAKYADVKNALTGLRTTLIDVGNKALVGSGILEQMAGALQAIGAWVQSHQNLFTAFFSAAAPYISDFTTFFLELTGHLLPLLTSVMNQTRPAVQSVLNAFLQFVQSGIAPFLSIVAQNAGVSAQAFGAVLNQLAPLLPLIGILAGFAAHLIVDFPQLTYVVLGLVVAFKGMLLITTISEGLAKLRDITIINTAVMWLMNDACIGTRLGLLALSVQEGLTTAASVALGFAMDAIPFVAIALAVIALTLVIVKYHAQILAAIVNTWNVIYRDVVQPVINWFTVSIPHAFDAFLAAMKSTMGTWAPILATLLLGPVAGAAVFITLHWNTIKNDTTAIFTAVLNFIGGWAKNVAAFFASMWSAVYNNTWVPVHTFFTATLPSWLNAAIAALRAQFVTPFQTAISGAWTWVVNNVWNPIHTFLTGTLPGWFSTAVHAIGAFWVGVEDIVRTPVAFVINSVLNPVGQTFDSITNALGLGKPIPVLHFASGGRVNAGTTPTADDVLVRVSRGETIVSAAHSAVLAPAFGAVGVPGYAAGGIPIIGSIAKSIPGAIGGALKNTLNSIIPGLGTILGVTGSAISSTAVQNVLSKILGLGTDGAGGSVKDILAKMGSSVVADMVKWLSGKQAAAASASGSQVPNVGSGVTRWTGVVDQALSLLHLPLGLASQVLYQMQTESGGNPNAINLTDSNAAAGDPSRGLLQTIGSTFAAYHVPGTSNNIYDPLANVAAAINYAEHVYGPTLMSNGAGLGSGHGYLNGGPIPEPVYGIGGISGDRYSFEAGENVQSRDASMAQARRLDYLSAQMERLIATTAAVPAGVGHHVGGALSGAAHDASFRRHYPMGGY